MVVRPSPDFAAQPDLLLQLHICAKTYGVQGGPGALVDQDPSPVWTPFRLKMAQLCIQAAEHEGKRRADAISMVFPVVNIAP